MAHDPSLEGVYVLVNGGVSRSRTTIVEHYQLICLADVVGLCIMVNLMYAARRLNDEMVRPISEYWAVLLLASVLVECSVPLVRVVTIIP